MLHIVLENDLEEIGRESNLQLLKNFSDLGISPWYSAGMREGQASCSAIFLRYDPLNTCFRLLPNAPRRFQGALKLGLISKEEANILTERLIGFCQHKLASYNGFYKAELVGRVSQIIRHAADIHRHGLLDIDKDLLPDDLYMAIPWPTANRYFDTGFVTIPRGNVISDGANQPLTALVVGIDVVCAGSSMGLGAKAILEILDTMDGKREHLPQGAALTPASNSKVVLPSITGGFSGVTIANFSNLPDGDQYAVLHHLYQVGETVGQKCQEIRYRAAERMLQTHNSLHDIAKAFILILPPTERIIVSRGKDAVGLRLRHEDGYWAGYTTMPSDLVLNSASNEESFSATIGGNHFRIQPTLVDNLPSLDPVLTRLRMNTSISRISSSLERSSGLRAVRRSELVSALEGLERQVAEGIKAQAASKMLYLLYTIIEHYDEGQARVHNEGARRFMMAKLGRAAAYQVAAKASDKLIKDALKLIPGLQFESTSAVLQIRWRPVNDQLY